MRLRIPPSCLFCRGGARVLPLTLVLGTGRLGQQPPQLILTSTLPGYLKPRPWIPAGPPPLALQREPTSLEWEPGKDGDYLLPMVF